MTDTSDSDFLTLRIGGTAAIAERLLLMRRPAGGKVRVREWTSNSWNTEGTDTTVDAAELLAEVEQAAAARQPVSEELFRVRHWLVGG